MIGFQDAQNFYQTLFFNREIRCRFSFIESSLFSPSFVKNQWPLSDIPVYRTKYFLHEKFHHRGIEEKKEMRMIPEFLSDLVF